MPRWKALPEGLPPAVVQLVAELRRLKDESGSSLSRLAARTDYSASSWDRYLGGRLLPPREAVESLARATGADPVPLLALHQAAREAWRSAPRSAAAEPEDGTAESGAELSEDPSEDPSDEGRFSEEPNEAESADRADEPAALSAAPTPAPQPTPTPLPAPTSTPARPHPGWRTVVTSAVAALAGAAIALAAVQPWNGTRACASVAPPKPPIVPSPPAYLCHYTQAGGLWEAGYSTTITTTTLVTMDSPVVVELQCLLQHAGFTPGPIDGSFGPMTEKAVVQFQVAKHLEIDGQVGPQTWGALRRAATG